MKKFLVKTALFIILVLVIDAALGAGFRYLVPHAKGGDTGRIEYICHRTSEDLLIFGSSRAVHHYDPFLLEDSLYCRATIAERTAMASSCFTVGTK